MSLVMTQCSAEIRTYHLHVEPQSRVNHILLMYVQVCLPGLQCSLSTSLCQTPLDHHEERSVHYSKKNNKDDNIHKS